MNKKPDAFLFCDGYEDWTYDEPEILGIPVFHTTSVKDVKEGTENLTPLFIPIWKEENVFYQLKNRCLFIEGYNDCNEQ
jgi:hypothetical protein